MSARAEAGGPDPAGAGADSGPEAGLAAGPGPGPEVRSPSAAGAAAEAAAEPGALRIALLQIAGRFEDPAASREDAAGWIANAAAARAQLALLPEMFTCGFGPRADAFAEPPGGETERFLVAQARERGLYVGGSIPERTPESERPFNTLLLAAPDGAVSRYRKRRLFAPAGEDRRFSAGHTTPTWTLHGLRVTPAICYDLRFPTLFWDRVPATDAFLVVASWPAARREHWRALLRARAIESQAYVCGVNRVGEAGGIPHAGDSAVIGPEGERLSEAAERETMVLFDLEAARIEAARQRFPWRHAGSGAGPPRPS